MKKCYLLTRGQNNAQPKFVVANLPSKIPYNYLEKNSENLIGDNEKFKQCFLFVGGPSWTNCPDVRSEKGRYFEVNKTKAFVGLNGTAVDKEKSPRQKFSCLAIVSSDPKDEDTSKRLGIIYCGENGTIGFMTTEKYKVSSNLAIFWNLANTPYIQTLENENIPIVVSEKQKEEAPKQGVDPNVLAKLKRIYSVVVSCKNDAAKELPLQTKLDEEKQMILIKAKVISDWAKRYTNGETKFKEFISIIKIEEGKIKIDCYNVYASGTKTRVYGFELPDNENSYSMIEKDRYFYIGFCGFVRGDINNLISTQQPLKVEYDAIETYTQDTNNVAGLLRFVNSEKYYKKDEKVRQLRAIRNLDNYFERCSVKQEFFVYRGLPFSGFLAQTGASSLESARGSIMSQTCYISTTLNVQSAIYFANPPSNKTDKEGVILRLKVPQGLKGAYVHDVAVWAEQFEFLTDRNYDIKVDDIIVTIDANGFKYHIVAGSFIPHTPRQKISPYAYECLQANKYITAEEKEQLAFFDSNGKLNFDTNETMNDIIGKTFELLKTQNNVVVQLQRGIATGYGKRDVIVIQGEKIKNKVTDYAFALKPGYSSSLIVFKIQGTDEKLRSYWSSEYRNEGALDKNFSLETYNYSEDNGKLQYYSTRHIGALTPQEIAKSILNFVKFNKNCITLPLQDICRYFDMIMKTTILNNGYILLKSTPVIKNNQAENEAQGHIKIQYMIDGDNDNSLIISTKFYKNGGKLLLDYSGKSKDGKVDSTSNIKWELMNEEIMQDVCEKILYEFAKNCKLNHTRRLDALLNYFENKTNTRIVKNIQAASEKLKNTDIHKKGNMKFYKIYFPNKNIITMDCFIQDNRTVDIVSSLKEGR